MQINTTSKTPKTSYGYGYQTRTLQTPGSSLGLSVMQCLDSLIYSLSKNSPMIIPSFLRTSKTLAHVPIFYDHMDWTTKLEDLHSLYFTVLKRTSKGFSSQWWRFKILDQVNTLRFMILRWCSMHWRGWWQRWGPPRWWLLRLLHL